jgi:ABC-2 type transport system ATP-binding protein
VSAAIQTDGLTKDYGATRALDGVTLRVERGEIFGFLGPNGAGKSTTIRLLLDLIRPTAGRAAVLERDCQAHSREVRACTGYLPGDVRLYPNLRGREIVDLIAGLRGGVDSGFVRTLAGRLELDLQRHARTLSKGNRQKLGILLALMARPPLLLLDEPTSGLDPLVQQVVWAVLREEAARGTTVFFSSHVMGEVEHTCTRVGILRGGRLVAVEPVATLTGRALRRFEVTFAESPPTGAFALPGVREVRRERATVWLEVSGDVDPVVRALARFRVRDLRTEQPSLEEILLAFYREEATP